MDVSAKSLRFSNSLRAYQESRSRCISLIAGQNIFSTQVATLLSSDLGNRIVEYVGGECLFPGMDEYLEIETLGKEIYCEALGASAVEIRPVTGSIANFIIYKALLNPGDLVASVSVRDGAHISTSARTLGHFGFTHFSLPFSSSTLTVDTSASIDLLRKFNPKLIVLGGSVLLFFEAIQTLSAMAKEIGAILVYDAAHVIGLMLSGHAPNPLKYGCDVLSFTTCKTIRGPQHAIICGREDLMQRISGVSSIWHSGYHLHEVAASVRALIEALLHGSSYSETVLSNSRRLANALDANGIPVLRDHRGEATETCMLLVDARRFGGPFVPM